VWKIANSARGRHWRTSEAIHYFLLRVRGKCVIAVETAEWCLGAGGFGRMKLSPPKKNIKSPKKTDKKQKNLIKKSTKFINLIY